MAPGPVWAWIDTLALTEHSDTLLSGTLLANPESAAFGDFWTF